MCVRLCVCARLLLCVFDAFLLTPAVFILFVCVCASLCFDCVLTNSRRVSLYNVCIYIYCVCFEVFLLTYIVVVFLYITDNHQNQMNYGSQPVKRQVQRNTMTAFRQKRSHILPLSKEFLEAEGQEGGGEEEEEGELAAVKLRCQPVHLKRDGMIQMLQT